jgi:hypothetical protein
MNHHPSMQQQYSKAKSMRKQSNNFIYKLLQTSNKLTWNNLLQWGTKYPQSPKHATTIFKGEEHREAVQQFHLKISTNIK